MTRNHTAGKPATEQTESMPAAGKPARSRRNGENREAAAARLPTGARTYPVDDEPDLWMPMPGAFDRRYALGHIGACNRDHPPLTIIGMNPSYASEHWSDRTVNRLIELSHILRSQDGERYRGWLMLNIYPQRTSKPNLLDDYNNHLSNLNCDAIRYLLPELGVDSVLGAWGDLGGHQGRPNPTLKGGLEDTLFALNDIGVGIYTRAPLTHAGNPRHISPVGGPPPGMDGATLWLSD